MGQNAELMSKLGWNHDLLWLLSSHKACLAGGSVISQNAMSLAADGRDKRRVFRGLGPKSTLHVGL